MVDPTDQPDLAAEARGPYARAAQTFPRLGREVAERVAGYGAEERLAAGTLVFERGEWSVDFFLVLEGKIKIFDLDQEGRPNVFTVHGVWQFTGEPDLFHDRILFEGRHRRAAARLYP